MDNRSFLMGALCNIGKVKKSNQDSILVKVGHYDHEEFGLFVVADGLGGLAHGERASFMVTEECKKWWEEELSAMLCSDMHINIDVIQKQLGFLIQRINKKIFEYAGSINARVGSTLSMLFLFKDMYVIKHIGDSRIYRISGTMEQMTEDHSWVAQQVREGKMTQKTAKTHAKRNILTRCLGVSEDIDLFETMGYVNKEDLFLLCSDGFYNDLDEREISDAIHRYLQSDQGDIQETVVALFRRVVNRGARDNISAIIIQQHEGKKEKQESLLLRFMKKIFNRDRGR